MIFSDEFLSSLPEDQVIAADKLCTQFIAFDNDKKNVKRKNINPASTAGVFANLLTDDSYHNEYIEALGIFIAFREANNIPIEPPELSSTTTENVRNITTFFRTQKHLLSSEVSKLSLEKAKNKYLPFFSKSLTYEFTKGDLDRIQKVISALRSDISKSNLFEADHKRRLLNRLEKLQSELHKKVSDLDHFWGVVGDAGVVIGKLGEDAKPFVDRFRELYEIIWRTQSRAEELPSDTPPPLLEGTPKKDY